MTHPIPDRAALKAQARRLRDGMAADGVALSHAQALEMIARQWGARDWNTLAAMAPQTPLPIQEAPATGTRWQVGQAVRGRYLGHGFTGRIKAARDAGGYWRLTVVFDQPVDVVASTRFSSWRRQVNCTVNGQGASAEKTSDGTPHMVLFAA